MKGYGFGQVGGNDGHQEALHIHIVEMRGHTPPQHVVKWRPLQRRGAVPSTTCPKTKRWACSRHGLWASCQRVMLEIEAGWGTRERLPRACFAFTPVWP